MKVLSDIMDEDANQYPLMFIKFFTDSEHRESFLNGNIYSNTFDYMVQCEYENGKGRGDAFEGINVMSNMHLKFNETESDKTFLEGTVGSYGLKTRINGTENMHMFCVTGVFNNWFEITEHIENTVTCRLKIPEYFQILMRREFGEHIVFFSAPNFINKLDVYGKENNLHILNGKVQYLNYSVNPKERIQAHIENNEKFYFQKDIFFEGQEEYRFIFPGLVSEKAEVICLGSKIDVVEGIKTIDDLVNSDFGLMINFDRPFSEADGI